MNSMNNIRNNQPQFGMAFRFKNGGAKRMAEAFINEPSEARKLVQRANKNQDVDIFVSEDKIDIVHKQLKNDKNYKDKLSLEKYKNNLDNHSIKSEIMLIEPELLRKDAQYFEKKAFYEAVNGAELQKRLGREITDKHLTPDQLAKELENLVE